MFPLLAKVRASKGAWLSGGEQQVLAIARALVANPGLLLLDEPSEGLAPRVVETLVEQLQMVRSAGLAMLLAEQHVRAREGAREQDVCARARGCAPGGVSGAEAGVHPCSCAGVDPLLQGGLAPRRAHLSRLRQVADTSRIESCMTVMGSTGAIEAPPALELRDVRKRFGGIRAVDGVSLRVGAGERVAVIGPNGAGKSTLFGLISGELRTDGGDVLLEGRSMRGVAPQGRARLGLGRTFQTARLFAGLSVRENVELAQTAGGSVGGDVAGALVEVGLSEDVERSAGVLAQGERKRLELAMVLAGEPRVLLLDEPTAGMGREERVAIMELVVGVAARRGLTMIFTEHDMDAVFAYARRVVVMDRGTSIADGAPASIQRDERVRRVYLGDNRATVERACGE